MVRTNDLHDPSPVESANLRDRRKRRKTVCENRFD